MRMHEDICVLQLRIPCAKCPPVVRNQIGEDGGHQGADESHAHKTDVLARCKLSFSVIFSSTGQICGGPTQDEP